jgi:hypothetical protein
VKNEIWNSDPLPPPISVLRIPDSHMPSWCCQYRHTLYYISSEYYKLQEKVAEKHTVLPLDVHHIMSKKNVYINCSFSKGVRIRKKNWKTVTSFILS